MIVRRKIAAFLFYVGRINTVRHYDRCPKSGCGSTNIDCKNGIWYCYDCGYEW